MKRLYLMRHGQTEYNLEKRVQGRCDSPLTELGLEQARRAGAWLADQGVALDRICTSPIGRARMTAETVRGVLETRGIAPAVPRVEMLDGLKERSYGVFEGGPQADVPADVWDPGELLVPYGGEGSAALRARMVAALTGLMLDGGVRTALAVSHGSATLQFKKAWEHLAACDQDRPLGNCCVLAFEFDERSGTFANIAIRNE